jgi:tetratricopeptide (TPR) repeat protein
LKLDGKCPIECSYNYQKEDGSTFYLKNKVDSIAEQEGFIKLQMDRWIDSEVPELNGRIPRDLAKSEEGKQEILKLFPIDKIPPYMPIDYLLKKLKIQTEKKFNPRNDYEVVGKAYIEALISEEYETLFKLSAISLREEFFPEFTERIKKEKLTAKFKTFEIVASALSEQKNEALVQFDMNNKHDLTLFLVFTNGSWYIKSRIYGEMKMVYTEGDIIKVLAAYMSRDELGNAYDFLRKYEVIYPDSPEMSYYWGLYYTLNGKNDVAKKHYLHAIRLDDKFVNAIYNYAFMLQAESNIEGAEKEYKRILTVDPHEAKTLNNLAVIALSRNDYETAEKYLNRCLKHHPEFEFAKKNLDLINSLKK